MTVDLLQLIKHSGMFAALDETALSEVLNQFKKVEVPKDKTLFRQGERSDGLYLVVSGRLVGLLRTPSHIEQFIGEIGPGETIGELGAISHEPRTATIKAVRDSVLLKLSPEQFSALCQQYPGLLMDTMTNLTRRSRSLIEMLSTPNARKRHIAILPADRDAPMTLFAEAIRRNLADFPEVAILSVHDPKSEISEFTEAELEAHVQNLQKQYKKIIYVLCVDDGAALTKLGLEKANMMYVVANATAKPVLTSAVQEKIQRVKMSYRAKPELILLHEKGRRLPRRTQDWYKAGSFGMVHQLRIPEEKDWQRILRFFSGRAIGVVLGGGGVRSWAHLGALKAIEEAGMPIDVIGGTSAGAIVAGHYALHEKSEDFHAKLRRLSEVTRKSVSLWNLTWPIVSIFNGVDFTRTVRSIFGNVRIENLWRPFFCITCDMNKSNAVVNRRGMLWRKTRASTSVPGIFPPMILAGRLQLDGGIANNLPVDVMKGLTDGIGTVIAVQLIHNVKIENNYKFPPALPFWRALLSKLGIIHREYRYPHFIDTFLRSLLVGSSVKQRECAEAADILISPDLSEFSLLSVTEAQEKKLSEVGYQAAKAAIKKWQSSQ